ncbi:hypothetical protein LTR78_008445 [Recurvomyces mirabilis]|uniref:C3H1-type domain-containing protein n=1 Tax=Recurvomyces mirabilis TaxID=574656 RepID=A0AAE0TR11_9PEZI|nr:hypothetical protein LTR78_008445 [Recurvomyces mirabilis]KAK5155433.1 hypothetical protein LTS14_005694 [Recurvomyces mirabilis]
MASAEMATIVLDLTSEMPRVNDGRYTRLVNELSAGLGPEDEAGGMVIALVVRNTNVISGNDVVAKFETAVKAWSTACEGVNTSWNRLFAFSQTYRNAGVKELAKRLPTALKSERLQVQGQIEEHRFKLARRLERARARRSHASNPSAARTLAEPQGQATRSHHEIPLQKTSKTWTREEQKKTADNQSTKTTSTIPPSGPKAPVLPGEKTCFFYCGHGGCRKTPTTCKFLHEMTDPLVIANPPPQYEHPSEDCGIRACPVMITRRQIQAREPTTPGARSALRQSLPYRLEDGIAASPPLILALLRTTHPQLSLAMPTSKP